MRSKKGSFGILSFGGAYSNHIHALAYACKVNNLKSIGIIRGEKSYQTNFTLSKAQQWGMSLEFVDRKTYREKDTAEYLAQLSQQYPQYYIVPEGGSNQLALSGVAEVCHELAEQASYDTLMTPVGSAGTISGLIKGDQGKHTIIGIAVLKQQGYLEKEVKSLLSSSLPPHDNNNWRILNDYHYGGYAKFSATELTELQSFQEKTLIPFEPVYSGKMILALLDLIKKGYFPKHHRIVLLHTGGLQGLGGLIEQKRLKACEWPLPPQLQAL